MKSLIKKIVNSAVRSDWIWNSLNRTIIPLARYMQIARQHGNQQMYQNSIKMYQNSINDIFSGMTVLHGPFAGMKYPEMASIGSSLFPKLLGSYEKELEPLMQRICNNRYTEVVDIGCAEGYYAVGLAMRINHAKVFAFDTDATAIQLCSKMAELNGVSEQLTTRKFCDAETLISLPLTERALIVSDCEGYEKKLFTKDNVPALSCHELLIEVHDCIDIGISSYLRELFESTHNIEVFSSIDDIKKAQEYSYIELEGLSLETKKRILAEGRLAIMEWFYMTPKPGKQFC